MAATYNDLTLDIRRSLRQAGIEAATLEARELVCFAAGKDRAALLRDGSLYASPETEEAAWALARRRLAGEPVAYLIGEWEFYGLPLDISESVLIPRPDTETLAEAAIGWLRQQEAPRVLDLCAGSGCLGLAIASQVPAARVVLGELSDGALRVCRQNIRRNGLTGRVTAISSGQATLTVTDGSGKGTCLVRVRGGSTGTSTSASGGSTASGSTLTAGTAVVVNAGNGVRVRAQANTSSEILATLSNGDSVRVVQSAGNGWYQISFVASGGVTTTGYMMGEYLSNS